MRGLYITLAMLILFNSLFYVTGAHIYAYVLFDVFALSVAGAQLYEEKRTSEKIMMPLRVVVTQVLVAIPALLLIYGALGPAWIASILVNALMLIQLKVRKSKLKRPEDNLDGLRFDTGTDWTTLKIKEIPSSSKSPLGGFVIPLLPIWVRIRAKPSLKYEAIIHEHMHIAWFIYGGQLAILYSLILFGYWLGWGRLLFGSVLIGWMILQEYLAFTSTKQYAKDNGWPDTRPFTKIVMAKYILVYGSYYPIVALVFVPLVALLTPLGVIGVIFAFVIATLLMFGITYLWYPVFKKLGWADAK